MSILNVLRGVATLLSLVSAACVVERPQGAVGVGSFVVEVLSIDPFVGVPAGCTAPNELGSPVCRRPFATDATPVTLRLRLQALDRQGMPFAHQGAVQLDVRPGRLVGVGPGGLLVPIVDGVGEVEARLAYTHGQTRLWVEDCGSGSAAGSFATGISPILYFDQPVLAQINETLDNTTSPMVPRADNICAITGDPRYGVGLDEDGKVGFVGYSRGGTVNAPPPSIGDYVEIIGCDRGTYDRAIAAGTTCLRGPLVVTGIGNEGFFLSDLNPSAAAGFAHLFAFNFTYPDDLEVGDILTQLRGSPVEFAGTTQLANPSWTKDGDRRGLDLLPTPIYLSAELYRGAVRTYGRDDAEMLDLERHEGALVCMDNLAPSARLEVCDRNGSGSIERQGCTIGSSQPLPPLCGDGFGLAPQSPGCNPASARETCVALTAEELTACGLTGYVPDNPAEYCCERICYNDFSCSESSAYIGFGQWVADVFGNYESDSAEPVKVAVISRDADPDFDPLAFGKAERNKPETERKRVRVIGHLRHVLAARPRWVIIARGPSDIAVDETCPQ